MHNKVNELNLIMANHISDRVIDEVFHHKVVSSVDSHDMNSGLVWYSGDLNTGLGMVKSGPIIKWSVIQMVIWTPDYFRPLFKW